MRKSSFKKDRIDTIVMRELNNIINFKLNSIKCITTVTSVMVTKDLKYAKVMVSILGNDLEVEETFNNLNKSIPFIRKQLAVTLNMRNTPELKFIIDDTYKAQDNINKILMEINKKENY